MATSFRTIALGSSISAHVRAQLRSPQYGHPAHREAATGTGPCRACLATFDVGREDRLLFTYNPFTAPGAYPSPGPVFIHAEPCAPCAPDSFPDALRTLPLLAEGYAQAGMLVARERIDGGDVESSARRLFALAPVEYLHLRHADAGCFIARLERNS